MKRRRSVTFFVTHKACSGRKCAVIVHHINQNAVFKQDPLSLNIIRRHRDYLLIHAFTYYRSRISETKNHWKVERSRRCKDLVKVCLAECLRFPARLALTCRDGALLLPRPIFKRSSTSNFVREKEAARIINALERSGIRRFYLAVATVCSFSGVVDSFVHFFFASL